MLLERQNHYQPFVFLESGVGSMPDKLSVLSLFGKDGTEVCIVNYQNDDGIFDLPDIKRLKTEKDMDY